MAFSQNIFRVVHSQALQDFGALEPEDWTKLIYTFSSSGQRLGAQLRYSRGKY